MAGIDDILTNALKNFEDTSGDSFTWAGDVYSCILSSVMYADDYDMGGERRMVSGSLEATRAQFAGTEPKYRDPIWVAGNKLLIKELDTDSTTLKIRFGSYSQ